MSILKMARKKKELTLDELQAKANRIGKRRKHEFSKEEERELILQAQNGSGKAMDKLIKVNEKYIMSFVRKRKHETELEVEDLRQEAIIGFMEAVNKFNPSFDVKIVTYAYYSVNRVLNSAVQKSKSLKISQYGFARYRKITQIIAEESKKTGIVPSIERIAEMMDLDKHIVDYILNMNNVYSLDSFKKDSNNDESNTYEVDSSLTQINKNQYSEEYEDLYLILDSLPPFHKKIILSYYGLMGYPKMKIADIKKQNNLSSEALTGILEQCFELIRESF